MSLPTPHAAPPAERPEPWYVAEGTRGERLLTQGRAAEAGAVFEALLVRLGATPSYARAVALGRLAQCAQTAGAPEAALPLLREALDVLGRLVPTDGGRALRGTLRSQLGDALRALGRYTEARKAYEAALKIAVERNDARARGIELSRLGTVALAEGRLDEALERHRAALALLRDASEPAMEAAAAHQVAGVLAQQGAWSEAERHYRDAARVNRRLGSRARLARDLSSLAELLQDQPGRLLEARELAAEALAIAQAEDPTAPEVWKSYGILAGITEREAAAAGASDGTAALRHQAGAYRELARYGPLIVATLARIGDAPSLGRAVLLGRMARSFYLAGRLNLALTRMQEAVAVAARVPESDTVVTLRASLRRELDELRRAGGIATATGEPAPPEPPGPADTDEITIRDDVTTDYVFDTNLLIDGPRHSRIAPLQGERPAPGDGVCPLLVPGARAWLDDAGAVRVSLPAGEPAVERRPECLVISRVRREVVIARDAGLFWRLMRGMDGAAATGALLSALAPEERAAGARLLAALAAAGAVDVSGRPVARFLHAATQKGVLPAGGLDDHDVARLAADGNYRAYPGAARIPVGRAVPERLRAFHGLTRARRSVRDYGGAPLSRDDFDALLTTACGVTGAASLPGAEEELRLRAYPSSGALYAVEIYPIVLRVAGLEPGVYHYRAVDSVLEVVRPGADCGRVAGVALPVERGMVSGVAAMVCLTGNFARHERKYGEGGYRMLVAEAGHVSENLILAATALGLAARPFGGVFDSLLNAELGLEGAEEQFLLAVLVGHASPCRRAPVFRPAETF